MFYILSFRPAFVGHFLDNLWKVFCSVNTPSISRQVRRYSRSRLHIYLHGQHIILFAKLVWNFWVVNASYLVLNSSLHLFSCLMAKDVFVTSKVMVWCAKIVHGCWQLLNSLIFSINNPPYSYRFNFKWYLAFYSLDLSWPLFLFSRNQSV